MEGATLNSVLHTSQTAPAKPADSIEALPADAQPDATEPAPKKNPRLEPGVA